MNAPARLLSLCLLTLFATGLPACARDFVLSSPLIEGQVIEQEIRTPIPGALVVVLWKGHLGWTGTVCFHVETATTDEHGIYRVPAWEKPSPYGDIKSRYHQAFAYKPGYEYVETKDGTSYLKPFAGSRGERLEYLRRVNSATTCGSAGESKKNLLSFAKAIYEEARGLAISAEEKKITDNLLFSVEIIELGYEAAERRDIERSRGRK